MPSSLGSTWGARCAGWVPFCCTWSPACSPASGTKVPNGHPGFAGGTDALPKPLAASMDKQRSTELSALDSECCRAWCSQMLRRSPSGRQAWERSSGSLIPQKQLEKSLLLLPVPPITCQGQVQIQTLLMTHDSSERSLQLHAVEPEMANSFCLLS